VWLDEDNKACNERLARIFGMSPAAWRSRGDFLSSFVAEEDRERFSQNYHHHVAALRHPVTFRFRALRGDGTTFEAETDMVPLSYAGRAVAYHFVREVSA
jgi:PAS domain S-box-containing protein